MWYVRVVALFVLLSAYALSVPLAGQQVYTLQSNEAHKASVFQLFLFSLFDRTPRYLAKTNALDK